MDELDKEIKSIFKAKSSNYKLSTKFINKFNETLTALPDSKTNYNIQFKAILATSCCALILVSGIVFAKDIEKIFAEKFHPMGKGISTAAENGYIAESEMNLIEKDMEITNKQTGEFIDTVHVKSKIESSIIANGGIGIELYFEFDSKLNEYVDLGKSTVDGNIDYENSHYFDFNNLFVLDNNHNIICCTEEATERCKNYYENNNLEYPDEINVTNINNIIGHIDNSDSNLIKLTVELTIRNDKNLTPSELYVSFNEFNLIPKLTNLDGIEANLKANDSWFMEIDIPEEMYDNTVENYKVIKCENENFNIYTAQVTNTGFELGLLVMNEEKIKDSTEIDNIVNSMPPYQGEFTREGFVEHYGEENVKLLEDYYNKVYLIRTNGTIPWIPGIERTEGCYVLNSKGEKFRVDYKNHKRTDPPIDDKYCFNVCFSMTKFDATDNITVTIDFKGEPVHIELEKVN